MLILMSNFLARCSAKYSQRTTGRYVTEDIKVIEDSKRALAQGQLAAFLAAMKQLGYERAEIIALLEEEA